jgi:hypothetical protein
LYTCRRKSTWRGLIGFSVMQHWYPTSRKSTRRYYHSDPHLLWIVYYAEYNRCLWRISWKWYIEQGTRWCHPPTGTNTKLNYYALCSIGDWWCYGPLINLCQQSQDKIKNYHVVHFVISKQEIRPLLVTLLCVLYPLVVLVNSRSFILDKHPSNCQWRYFESMCNIW